MIMPELLMEQITAPIFRCRHLGSLKIGLILVSLLALSACSNPLAKLQSLPQPATNLLEPEIPTASISNPAQAGFLGLPEAARMALQRHPDILRAKSYVIKSATGIALANSVWYPELSYGVSPTYSKNSYGSATAGVSQLVYDFGKSEAELGAAQALQAKSEHEVNQAEEAVAAQIAQDYTNLAASIDQIDQARGYLVELQKLASRVESRVRAGASDASDSATATVAVDRAQGEVLRAQSQFATAKSNIAEVLGQAPERVSAMQDIALLLQKITEHEESKVAPSLLALQSAVEAARHNIDRAHADVLPPLKLAGQYTEQVSKTGFSGSSWLGLQVTGTFSTSGAAGQKIASAEADFVAAQQLLESEKLRLRIALGASDIEVSAAIQRAENNRRIHDLAVHSNVLSWQEYQLDKKPLNDVISAERDKYTAMSDVINARADFIKAMIKGLANKGRLSGGLLAVDQK